MARLKCRKKKEGRVTIPEKKASQVLPSATSGAVTSARKRYYTISQIAGRWGVSAPTVIRLIEEGQLTGLKIRGVYRISRDSVESYERKVAF